MGDKSLKTKRIGVLLGGWSAERAVSLKTGDGVIAALAERGFDSVARIDVGRDIATRLREEEVEVAFIALHGGVGENGALQGLLEVLGVPYTGSGVLASALALDKISSKRLFTAAGLPTPAWCYPATRGELMPPLVLKPFAEGSSVGVQLIDDQATLERLLAAASDNEQLMLEQYIPGRELAVAVFGHGEAARSLGMIEIEVAEGFYDYEAKYERDDTRYTVAPALPQAVQVQVEEQAVAAHRLLGCRGVTRVDFRWDESRWQASRRDAAGEPALLEVNTLPGLTSHSLVPKIADHVGISYSELIERIVEDALS